MICRSLTQHTLVFTHRLVAVARFTIVVATAALTAEPLVASRALFAQRARNVDAGIVPASLDSLRAHIRRVLDSTKTPSMAVAVAKNGRIIWEE